MKLSAGGDSCHAEPRSSQASLTEGAPQGGLKAAEEGRPVRPPGSNASMTRTRPVGHIRSASTRHGPVVLRCASQKALRALHECLRFSHPEEEHRRAALEAGEGSSARSCSEPRFPHCPRWLLGEWCGAAVGLALSYHVRESRVRPRLFYLLPGRLGASVHLSEFQLAHLRNGKPTTVGLAEFGEKHRQLPGHSECAVGDLLSAAQGIPGA